VSVDWSQVQAVFDAKGVPTWVWYPIVWVESLANPQAIGDGGCSIGLFQLNRCGGQGQGYTVAQLQDPVFNAQLASDAIAHAWEAVKTTALTPPQQAFEVARQSGHPVNTAFPQLVSTFMAQGSQLGSAIAGDTTPGNPPGEPIDFPGADWLSQLFGGIDLMPLILIGGGAFIVVLVIIATIFKSQTVREVVKSGAKAAAVA